MSVEYSATERVKLIAPGDYVKSTSVYGMSSRQHDTLTKMIILLTKQLQ